jgi:hypothetical protein
MIEGRIRYDNNYHGREAYVYEFRGSEDEEWQLETVFYLDGNDKLSYLAVATISEWMYNGIDFHFC